MNKQKNTSKQKIKDVISKLSSLSEEDILNKLKGTSLSGISSSNEFKELVEMIIAENSEYASVSSFYRMAVWEFLKNIKNDDSDVASDEQED